MWTELPICLNRFAAVPTEWHVDSYSFDYIIVGVKYAFTVEVVQFQETTSIIMVKHRFPSLSGRVHGGLRWR